MIFLCDHKLNNCRIQSPCAGKTGSTLIEVMLSCVILAIIAVAGAEYIYRGQSTLVVQKNRRIALEVANSRLEEIRATPYYTLTNFLTVGSYTPVTVLRSNNTFWARSGEKVSIGGAQVSMTNTLEYKDDGSVGGNSYDAIKATVSVGYKSGLNDQVILQTWKAP